MTDFGDILWCSPCSCCSHTTAGWPGSGSRWPEPRRLAPRMTWLRNATSGPSATRWWTQSSPLVLSERKHKVRTDAAFTLKSRFHLSHLVNAFSQTPHGSADSVDLRAPNQNVLVLASCFRCLWSFYFPTILAPRSSSSCRRSEWLKYNNQTKCTVL